MTACDHCGYQSVMAHYDEVRCVTCGARPKQADPLPLIREDSLEVTTPTDAEVTEAEASLNLAEFREKQAAEIATRQARVRQLSALYNAHEIARDLGICVRTVFRDLGQSPTRSREKAAARRGKARRTMYLARAARITELAETMTRKAIAEMMGLHLGTIDRALSKTRMRGLR